MREIFPKLTEVRIKQIAEAKLVAKREAIQVECFEGLIKEVAKLSYAHKDYLLFFRGQEVDHLNKKNSKSTFLPSFYRTAKGILTKIESKKRFEVLEGASSLLIKLLERKNIFGYQDVKQRKEIQWSILQHYEVCSTPYLDLTQSLRVACSFAVMPKTKASKGPDKGYLYVFGLPYITNRISVNSEHDLINIRLLSICPPEALRPHHQEGFLVGTTNIADEYKVKHELDFNRRLIAKFEFQNDVIFWGKGRFSSKIRRTVLYPKNDMVGKICESITLFVKSGVFEKPNIKFIALWNELEELIDILSPHKKSIKENLTYLRSFHSIDVLTLKEIKELCAFKIKLEKESPPNETILENYLLLYLFKKYIEENISDLIEQCKK